MVTFSSEHLHCVIYVALLSDRQKGLANAKGLIQRITGWDINGNWYYIQTDGSI